MDIWGYICMPFGYLIKWCYEITGSYAVSLFIFALMVKIVLFPFGVKQQKNSIKQAKLRPKEQAIRKKYAGRNDQATQQKMQQEIMDFYQKEGYNPAGGCLPLLIQMPIILALYSVVRSPLTYISGVADKVPALKEITAKILNKAENAIDEIQIVQAMNNSPEMFKDYDFAPPVMEFFGIHLEQTPQWSTFFTAITLIPVLVLITGYLQQFAIQKMSYQPNPEAAKQMRTMNLVMPLMSVWFSFILPAALGLYWSFQNILAIAQQFILYKAYPIPVITEEEMKAAEREMKAANRNNARASSASNSKRRSLVYDDDIPEVVDKPTPRKKAETDKTKEIIPPAPLKEDNVKNTDEEVNN